jgi:hypothetical protein
VDEALRPAAVRVMAEYMDDDPVWCTGPGHYGPVVLDSLGVSADLVRRLRAWNARYGAIARSGFECAGVQEERDWRRDGLHLAYELQSALPDIEVSYAEDGDPRPVRDRRGP